MIAVTYLLFLVSSPFHQGYQIYLFAVEITGIQYSYCIIVQPVRIVRLTLILKLITRRLQQRLRCPALAQVKVVRGARYYNISLDTSQSVYKYSNYLCPNMGNSRRRVEKGSKYRYKLAIIGPPAKRHSNGVLLAGR